MTLSENPWLYRRVIAYAHQGGALDAPSSTLYALRHAVDAGATALELDVHATADGELVVCHDATVDRTTNGCGAIAQLSLEELRRLDNAYWFVPGLDAVRGREPSEYVFRGRAPEDREFGIPTLREVLAAFPDVVLNIDIKQTAPAVKPYEATLASLLNEYERSDDVIVTSFDERAIEAFSRLAPNVPTAAGPGTTTAFWVAAHAGGDLPPLTSLAFQVPERHGVLSVVDECFVDAAHRHGLAVHVWTVNDPDAMRRLVDLEVDGIMSDVPNRLVGVLRERNAYWPGSRRQTSG